MKLSLKKLFVSVLILGFSQTQVYSQPAANGEPQKLIEQSGIEFMNPVWSPNGENIAFTSPRYNGLWIADSNGENIKKITDESAGFGFSWSSDSESILTRVSEYQNKRRKLAVKVFHINGQEPTQVTDFRDSMTSLPLWAGFDEKIVLIQDSKIESFDSGKEIPQKFKQSASQPFYVIRDNQIAKGKVPVNSTEDVSPFDEATYMNLQVSPDGKKLAFEIYGGNLFVMNIDGTNLRDLGNANRPNWSPDSKYIVAMVTEDDGHNYVKSDIYAFSTDGNERINLTESTNLIAMNPDWSPKGDLIVFDSPDSGAIYALPIKY